AHGRALRMLLRRQRQLGSLLHTVLTEAGQQPAGQPEDVDSADRRSDNLAELVDNLAALVKPHSPVWTARALQALAGAIGAAGAGRDQLTLVLSQPGAVPEVVQRLTARPQREVDLIDHGRRLGMAEPVTPTRVASLVELTGALYPDTPAGQLESRQRDVRR